MTHPTEPGQRCRVTGGRTPFNGEGKSPNEGKKVTTMFLHEIQAGGEMENVWRCKAAEGVIVTYYGAGTEADFLECWLEVEPPEEQTPKELVKELETPV